MSQNKKRKGSGGTPEEKKGTGKKIRQAQIEEYFTPEWFRGTSESYIMTLSLTYYRLQKISTSPSMKRAPAEQVIRKTKTIQS